MKILNGKYNLYLQVPIKCPFCGKIGMHLKDGRYGSFLSCSEFPSCHGSFSVSVDVEENILYKIENEIDKSNKQGKE